MRALRLFVALASLELASGPALAQTPEHKLLISRGVYQPPSMILNFANGGPYCLNGFCYSTISSVPGWGYSRTGAATAVNTSGTVVNFAANTPRITNQGILIEQSATNVALWSRDLTNAAWTKTNVTAALNQVGADGAASSASSLTASAGNGTALQSVTLSSSVRAQSAWIKRITGSGNIQMTTDGGTTWTTLTSSNCAVNSVGTAINSSGYVLCAIPTQTLANPSLGFRIVTNGDAIAVDFVQNETTLVTSSIPTSGTAVTRAADVAYVANAPIGASGAVIISAILGPQIANSNALGAYNISDNCGFVRAYAGGSNTSATFRASGSSLAVTTAAQTQGGVFKSASAWSLTGRTFVVNSSYFGSDSVNPVSGCAYNTSGVNIGGLNGTNSFWNGPIKSITVYPNRMSLTAMQAATR